MSTDCMLVAWWNIHQGQQTGRQEGIALTDGAGAYQSLAPRSRIAHHTKDTPPSFNKARYKEHYAHLKLSHGVVSHEKQTPVANLEASALSL